MRSYRRHFQLAIMPPLGWPAFSMMRPASADADAAFVPEAREPAAISSRRIAGKNTEWPSAAKVMLFGLQPLVIRRMQTFLRSSI